MTFGRKDDRISIFDALRPGTGQTVSRAVVTTYSLDLVAMLGLVLALGGDAENEFEASPLGLVKAFDSMRGKLLVLHQLGRVVAPSAHRSILPLLDTMVHAVASNERRESWHPKVALARYVSEKGSEWRFWIGSRNLTGSTDRDAGLLLVSAKGRGARRIPDVAALAEDLLAGAGLTSSELAELKAAGWSAPPGVSVRSLRWRRNGQTRRFVDAPLLARADRGCAVSPFIDRGGLAEAMQAGVALLPLLTTELAGKGCAPFGGVTFRVDAAPEPAATVSVEQQQDEVVGEFNDPPSTGIHAKLIAVSKGDRTALMLGSANLTRRGLVGPNAEAVIILDINDPGLADSLYGFVQGGVELEDVEVDVSAEQEKEKAKRELDGLISRFLEGGFRLVCAPDALHLELDVAAEVLGMANFAVSPFLDAGAWISIPPGSKSIRLLANQPPISEQTALVNFRASSMQGLEVRREWVQAVEIEGIDFDRRDRALLARYVGASRFRDWLRSLLDGVDGTGGGRWSDPVASSGPRDPSDQLSRIFTLETMLAAWARDPQAFERRVSGMIRMLESFAEVFAQIEDDGEREAAMSDLEEVRPFLDAVHDAIGVGVAP